MNSELEDEYDHVIQEPLLCTAVNSSLLGVVLLVLARGGGGVAVLGLEDGRQVSRGVVVLDRAVVDAYLDAAGDRTSRYGVVRVTATAAAGAVRGRRVLTVEAYQVRGVVRGLGGQLAVRTTNPVALQLALGTGRLFRVFLHLFWMTFL